MRTDDNFVLSKQIWNQIRSDQIRSDQIRSDQIRSDQIRSDQIGGSVPLMFIIDISSKLTFIVAYITIVRR